FGVSLLMQERQAMGQLTHETHRELTVEAIRGSIEGAALLWIESPTNPMLDVVDLPAVIGIAKGAGVMVVVDNTFATPMGQHPIEHGADLVMHSGTKMIGGHSDLMLGLAVAATEDLRDRLVVRRHNAGGTPGALEAYL